MIRASLLSILCILSSFPAAAQSMCGDRAALLARVAEEFGEAPVAIGLASNGGVVELLTSAAGGWTLIVTFAPRAGAPAANRTCLIATGEGWQSIGGGPRDGEAPPSPGDARPGSLRRFERAT